MEFLRPNLYDTTTQIVVNSNTDSAQYLMDADVTFQYVSSALNTDGTIASIRINFTETVTVDRIAIVGHNLKQFRVFYNGATANTFLLNDGVTTVSNFSTNSETALYMRTTTTACTSVSLDMYATIVPNQEKAVGYLVATQTHVVMDRPPPSKGYDLQIDPHDIVHKLSDGGTRIQVIADKKMMRLSYSYLSESVRNSLFNLWNLHSEFIVAPFGTMSSWDKIIFPCVWDGAFEFYKFSDNAAASGFSGKIMLRETPR